MLKHIVPEIMIGMKPFCCYLFTKKIAASSRLVNLKCCAEHFSGKEPDDGTS